MLIAALIIQQLPDKRMDCCCKDNCDGLHKCIATFMCLHHMDQCKCGDKYLQAERPCIKGYGCRQRMACCFQCVKYECDGKHPCKDPILCEDHKTQCKCTSDSRFQCRLYQGCRLRH